MPFMIGPAPIRRTLKYLEAGKLILKDQIQIFSINYNTNGKHHYGIREFIFWNLPQLQYKNPTVQVITFKNLTPTPFVKCYYDDGKTMLIDVDNKERESILDHLIAVVGKSDEVLKQEAMSKQKLINPANVGVGCRINCMCTVLNQVPCPATVPLPFHMRGKKRNENNE